MSDWPGSAPPRLAERVLEWATLPEYRDDVLGDLHEEFLGRRRGSEAGARRWYWSQAARSLPRLIVHRARVAGARRLLMLLVAYALAMLAMSLWDAWVSRRVAMNLAAQDAPWSLATIRTAYFLVLALGALLAGALAAALTFRRHHSLGANLAIGIAPVILLTAGLLALNLLAHGRADLVLYAMARFLVLTPPLVVGACLYAAVARLR